MTRRVFFSFHHQEDIFQVMQVRNSWNLPAFRDSQPILDKAEFEKIKLRGQDAVKSWIDTQMKGCGVLVVLIGEHTHSRPWVKYEIASAHLQKMGILGISLGGMKTMNGYETKGYGLSPFNFVYPNSQIYVPEYPIYNWVTNFGRENIGNWVENAARLAGR